MRPTRPLRLLVVMPISISVLALAGCGGGDDAPPDASASPTPLATKTVTGRVVGKLAPGPRDKAVAGVSDVVDGWIDAAFGGDYPRSDFKDAFPGFTPGAARKAAGDADLMTNADLGPKIDGIEMTRRRVAVDLLATRGKARTATARVNLAFTTDGQVEQRRVVAGRLFLTWDQGWTVFGYDMTQNAKAKGAAK